MEYEIKIALRLLHKIKIIHKDIKPQNILYSNYYNRTIFIDFGISQTII
jgi:serine/threonine protein kinase